jgi:hypothetical protein
LNSRHFLCGTIHLSRFHDRKPLLQQECTLNECREQTVGKSWAMDSQDFSGGRGGRPKGLKQFFERTPANKSKALLPWKLYEAG